ncbi:hypothetical protein BKA69DRAFT_1108218 [Paraphysoderma sedebokerense]|nr:hypothetical protein BKA69DRAFT_1108218 [Paraphysoderma sedebokerense]
MLTCTDAQSSSLTIYFGAILETEHRLALEILVILLKSLAIFVVQFQYFGMPLRGLPLLFYDLIM